MQIASVGTAAIAGSSGASSSQKSAGGFQDLFMKALSQVNDLQTTANQDMQQMLAGKADLVQTVTATEKANLALELTVQVRNKLLSAYTQVMQMQI